MAPGQHSYTATFVAADSATYAGSTSATRSVTVAPIVTTTDLTVDTTEAQSVRLLVLVTGASGIPAGTVVFREGSTVVLGTMPVLAGRRPSP